MQSKSNLSKAIAADTRVDEDEEGPQRPATVSCLLYSSHPKCFTSADTDWHHSLHIPQKCSFIPGDVNSGSFSLYMALMGGCHWFTAPRKCYTAISAISISALRWYVLLPWSHDSELNRLSGPILIFSVYKGFCERLNNELCTSQVQTFLMVSVMRGLSLPNPADVI